MELLAVNAHAPLAAHRHHPGSRLHLQCSLCGWQRTYDPDKVAARLVKLKRGGPMTPVSAVAQWIAWPCPMCRRVRWRTGLVSGPAAAGGPGA